MIEYLLTKFLNVCALDRDLNYSPSTDWLLVVKLISDLSSSVKLVASLREISFKIVTFYTINRLILVSK